MTATTTTRGADLVVEALADLGVQVAFGLPGVHNLPIWKALSDSSIRLIGVRHEQAAAYAADGYSRATGKLGVALVTTGPGAANTLGAVGEAMASGSSVLVLATDIPQALRRPGVYRGVLHETRDQAAMFEPVTRAATTVSRAEQIADEVLEAGARALAAPAGPVYLGIPTDLLSLETGAHARRSRRAHAPAGGAAHAPPRNIDEGVDLLHRSQRPLIWAGGGALRAGAGDAIGELATKLVAPVITTYMGRGVISPDHPCAAPGPAHQPQIGALWDEADVVIAIGSDLDGMSTQNWAMPAPPRLLAINVDPDDAAKSYRPDVTLVGDARAMTAALVDRVEQRPGLEALRARLSAIADQVRAAIEDDEPQALELLDAIATTLPQDAVIVADMCIPGYWLGGFHRVPAPRKLAYPVGWGTLGFAFPASLGVAATDAGRAVCICGDGGFLFACGELATAAQERLPVTIVIVDDGGYGMLRFDQIHAGDRTFGVDLQTPDFVELARAFGVPAARVRGFGEDFMSELRDSLSVAGPIVIVVEAALRPPPTTSPRWYRKKEKP